MKKDNGGSIDVMAKVRGARMEEKDKASYAVIGHVQRTCISAVVRQVEILNMGMCNRATKKDLSRSYLQKYGR